MAELINNKLGHYIGENLEKARRYLKELRSLEKNYSENALNELIEAEILNKQDVEYEVERLVALANKKLDRNFVVTEKHAALVLYLKSSNKTLDEFQKVEKQSSSIEPTDFDKQIKKTYRLLQISEVLYQNYSLGSKTGLTEDELCIAFEDFEEEMRLLVKKAEKKEIQEDFRKKEQLIEKIEKRNTNIYQQLKQYEEIKEEIIYFGDNKTRR